MLSSGTRSYYDDYARKKGSSRLIHDPPSLLTDRGAYVNFLEVQLERVSAACLGVQSQEQRFTDMHEKLSMTEDKVSSAMRLVGLAQQCTEEVRHETDTKLSFIKKQFNQEHNEMITSLQVITDRISIFEKSVNTALSSMLPRLDQLEQRLNDEVLGRQRDQVQHNEEIKQLKDIILNLESSTSANEKNIMGMKENILEIEKNRADESAKYDVNLRALDIKFTETLSQGQENIYRKIDDNFRKLMTEYSNLDNELTTKLIAVKQSVQDNSSSFFDKISSFEEQLYDNDKKYYQNLQDIENKVSEHIRSKDTLLESLLSIQEGLKVENETLYNQIRHQFEVIEDEIGDIHDIIDQNNIAISNKFDENLNEGRVQYGDVSENMSAMKDAIEVVRKDVMQIADSSSFALIEASVMSKVKDTLGQEVESLRQDLKCVQSDARYKSSTKVSHSKYSRELTPVDDSTESDDAHNLSKDVDESSDDDGLYNKKGRQSITKDLCSSNRKRYRISKARKPSNKHTQNDTKSNSNNDNSICNSDPKPIQNAPQATENSDPNLKEILSNFLDVYLNDQKAIRERLLELGDARAQDASPKLNVELNLQKDPQYSDSIAQQRDVSTDDTKLVNSGVQSIAQTKPTANVNNSDSKTAAKRSSSGANHFEPESTINQGVTIQSTFLQETTQKKNPLSARLSNYLSDTVASKSYHAPISRNDSKKSSKSVYGTSPSRRLKQDSTAEFNVRVNSDNKGGQDNSFISNSFEFDDVYENDSAVKGERPESEDINPAASSLPTKRVLLPYFNRIPRPVKSPTSSPVRLVHQSAATAQRNSRSKFVSKSSPFANMLSKKPVLPLSSSNMFSSSNVREKSNVPDCTSPGSDVSNVTSTTSTSSSIPVITHHSGKSHLRGAGATVKSTDSTSSK